MFRVKKFLSLTALVIGGLIAVSLLLCFSVAQSYDSIDVSLIDRILHFIMPKRNVYLYAITEPNTYTVSFSGNWGTWVMSGMNMVYDKTGVNLPLNEFTRDWYSFLWWSRSESWDVEYLNGAEVSNLTYVESWSVILYAQRWGLEVPYIIEYYKENVDWTWYDLIGTGNGYGPIWPYIITTGQEYTWFTLQTWAEVSIVSGWTVSYYYTRNPYDLTIVDRGNTSIITWIKYWADIPLPADPEWSWNTFDGWNNLPSDWKMPASNLEITSKWTYGVHTITFDTDGWTKIEAITWNYGDVINKPGNPTKEWYEFVRWEPEIPDTIPYDDIEVKAIWKEIESWKWWSGRWWGWSSSGEWDGKSADWEWDKQHGSPEDNDWMWLYVWDEKVDLEVFFAYMWAHDMWIIESSWKNSDPDGYVTRWDMAEMVVKFAKNVLNWDIPEIIPERCVWWDVNKERKLPETKMYAEKACALGVMWIRMKDFMPNKILDRAEFGTILSRLLWWSKYDVVDATKTKLYYTKHLEALHERKIMIKIDNPEWRKELRKWAWLMLMRARIEERQMK